MTRRKANPQPRKRGVAVETPPDVNEVRDAAARMDAVQTALKAGNPVAARQLSAAKRPPAGAHDAVVDGPAHDPQDAAALRDAQALRALEAMIFAAPEPLSVVELRQRLASHGLGAAPVQALLGQLEVTYAARGVKLVRVANKWRFQTAADLAPILAAPEGPPRKLSAAARETLAIIAYHQPTTRAEVEAIRGVAVSKGALDVLMEAGWVRPRGRRRTPGRPIVYVTTDQFLAHFGLESLEALPGKEDLAAAGLLDPEPPADFTVPDPMLALAMSGEELPLDEDGDEDGEGFQADFLAEDTDGAPDDDVEDSAERE